jgi:hypothetical protein
MKCECGQFQRTINIETYPNRLVDRLDLIDTKDGEWLKLYRCSICGQYWQFDLADRLQVNLAIKIDEPCNWQDFNDKPARLQHLIDSRSGLSEEICVMTGCQDRALKTLAHCPAHAYEVDGLRQ